VVSGTFQGERTAAWGETQKERTFAGSGEKNWSGACRKDPLEQAGVFPGTLLKTFLTDQVLDQGGRKREGYWNDQNTK